jgi:hypothetical protein
MKSIAQQLREHIWARDLSLQYGAGKIVSAHLGIAEKTARSQLASLTNVKKAPETIVILERLCKALGLEIVIQPIQPIESPKDTESK